MVHAKNFDCVLERSILLILLLAMLPAHLNAQELKLSQSFLEGRAYMHGNAIRQLDAVSGQASSQNSTIQNPAAPLYDVIALRVSFQPDTSRFTTGDGQFGGVLFDSLESNVDPLPHDAGYFDAHLQFLANYVNKVSDGNTQLNTHLIPEVIQVSQEMAAYSPTGFDASSDTELSKLARLVEEAWTLADQQSTFDMSGFDPATTALILFHAGVGRDIELVGTSLDKTPQDLPTIFFNHESLNRLLPASQISFKGFPVQHTILMPRTESRLGFDFIQDIPFLVEFSVNGLLAASFFNFLGVPDLFNTATGESAIGPFGLMDPLGLFAYNGLFPPEPSAWTKQYLNWTLPALQDGEVPATLQLIAAGSNAQNELVKVPISASEYFLIENRNRDVNNDGLTLTIYRDGQTFTQQVENDQEDFNSINIDGFEGGVVVDVDDFDWALPGGVDADGNDLIGGITIWHIDERILANGLALNQVNIDPRQRAVDLEEADGSQDIGFPSDNIFGPQAFLGSPFDFYYEGNPVVVIASNGEEIRLYQNRLGPATYPNSNSNAGGPSFIVLDAFSLPGSTMNFSVRKEANAGMTPLEAFPSVASSQVPPGSYVTSFSNGESNIIFQSNSGDLLLSTPGALNPTLISSNFIKSPTIIPGGRLAALSANAQNEAMLAVYDNGEFTEIPLGVDVQNLSANYNHLLYDDIQFRLVALINHTSGSSVLEIDLNPNNLYHTTTLASLSQAYSISATRRGEVAVLHANGVSCIPCASEWQFAVGEDAAVGQLVLGEDESGLVGAFTNVDSEKLIFLLSDGETTEVDLSEYGRSSVSSGSNRFPILIDLDRDGRLEALLPHGQDLMAFQAGGGMADGFPIHMPTESTTQPLVIRMAEVEGDVVLIGASDGYIHAIPTDPQTRQVAGFPLAVGSQITATPAINGNTLYAVDSNGAVKAWERDNVFSVWWGQQNADASNTSFVVAEDEVIESASRSGNGDLFIPDQNYNWPNPIRNGETYFRLSPKEDVKIVITIIDTAGGFIDELTLENVRGDTATDIKWQTDAASGLYYARIKAIAGDGASETQLIKMAIVR